MTYHTFLQYILFNLRKNNIVFFLFILLLIGVLGCSPVIRFGRIPDISKLETSLKPQVSTRADILEVLGQPRCNGGAMMPGHDSPRELWLYYYEEATLSDDRRIFLFVFLNGDLYDGYLWFSTLPDKIRGN